MKKIIPLLFIFFTCLYLPAYTQYWSIIGNAGTSNSNFIGTTDTRFLNIRVGNQPSGSIDSASRSAFFGYKAFSSGSGVNGDNTGFGHMVMVNNQGGQNTALGAFSLLNNTTGTGNTGLGSGSMYTNTTGSYNSAMGLAALRYNTTGGYNSVMGGFTMYQNTTGMYNTAIGYSTLYATTASYYNTALGYFAGGGAYNNGWNNVYLGANTRPNGANFYNVIAIGQDIVSTAVNQARIGNMATTSIGGYVGWTNLSDGRYKKEVKENVKGLEFIMQLRPVTYHLDVVGINKKLGRPTDINGKEIEADPFTKKSWAEKEKQVFTGFIAQEVETAAKKAGYDFSGVDKPGNENDFYGLRYAEFVVPLVKGMQEQQQEIADLKKEIELLKEQNKLLLGVTKK